MKKYNTDAYAPRSPYDAIEPVDLNTFNVSIRWYEIENKLDRKRCELDKAQRARRAQWYPSNDFDELVDYYRRRDRVGAVQRMFNEYVNTPNAGNSRKREKLAAFIAGMYALNEHRMMLIAAYLLREYYDEHAEGADDVTLDMVTAVIRNYLNGIALPIDQAVGNA